MRARIRSLDLYSGHADGTELRDWIKERQPIRYQVFLVHGEEPAMAGLAARLDGIVAAGNVLQPGLDEAFVPTPDGAQILERTTPPRLSPEKVALIGTTTCRAYFWRSTKAFWPAPTRRPVPH